MPASAEPPLRRLLFALRHDPPRTVAMKMLSELGYRRLLLLARALDRDLPSAGASCRWSCELLASADAAEYRAFRPDIPPEQAEARWRAGHLCFVARTGGRIVSACWAASRNAWADYLGCAVPLDAGEAYLFDAYTLPDFRGQGVAPALCRGQLAHFGSRGYRRAVRLTLPENAAALRAHAKSGFVPVGVVGRVKVGPWQHVFRRSWARDPRAG